MNYSTAVFLINANVRAVLCTYEAEDHAKKTMFKTLDKSVRVGDLVVVPTDTRHKMTVCKVTDVDVDVDFDCATPVNWVVTKVDRAAHETTLSQEAEAIATIKSAETRKKRDELRAAIMYGRRSGIAGRVGEQVGGRDLVSASPEERPPAKE